MLYHGFSSVTYTLSSSSDASRAIGLGWLQQQHELENGGDKGDGGTGVGPVEGMLLEDHVPRVRDEHICPPSRQAVIIK
jgi:hypothetical protein